MAALTARSSIVDVLANIKEASIQLENINNDIITLQYLIESQQKDIAENKSKTGIIVLQALLDDKYKRLKDMDDLAYKIYKKLYANVMILKEVVE